MIMILFTVFLIINLNISTIMLKFVHFCYFKDSSFYFILINQFHFKKCLKINNFYIKIKIKFTLI